MSNKVDYAKEKSKNREQVSSQTLPTGKRGKLVKLKCYMFGENSFTESKKDSNRTKPLLTEAKCLPCFSYLSQTLRKTRKQEYIK